MENFKVVKFSPYCYTILDNANNCYRKMGSKKDLTKLVERYENATRKRTTI